MDRKPNGVNLENCRKNACISEMLVLQYIPYDLYGDFAPVFARFFRERRKGQAAKNWTSVGELWEIGSKKRLVFQAFRFKTQSSERGRTQDVKGGFLR